MCVRVGWMVKIILKCFGDLVWGVGGMRGIRCRLGASIVTNGLASDQE